MKRSTLYLILAALLVLGIITYIVWNRQQEPDISFAIEGQCDYDCADPERYVENGVNKIKCVYDSGCTYAQSPFPMDSFYTCACTLYKSPRGDNTWQPVTGNDEVEVTGMSYRCWCIDPRVR